MEDESLRLLNFRCPAGDIKALRTWAREDGRTLSNLIRLILRDALRDRQEKAERRES